jgi:glutamate synthase (ferredoxin)
MSTETAIGSERNLLKPGPEHARLIELKSPILTNEEFAKLKHLNLSGFRSVSLPILFKAADGAAGLQKAMDDLCQKINEAVKEGYNVVVLSDRGVNKEWAPIPSLLAVAGVHHHLIREGTRTQVGLVLESGEPREVHHFSLLIGYVAGRSIVSALNNSDMRRWSGLTTGIDHKGLQDHQSGVKKWKVISNGHFDHPELLGRADFRSGRSQTGVRG